MYEIDTKLAALEREGRPIHVALIGAGQMGKDIVAQIAGMQGMRCDVVVDISLDAAREALRNRRPRRGRSRPCTRREGALREL